MAKSSHYFSLCQKKLLIHHNLHIPRFSPKHSLYSDQELRLTPLLFLPTLLVCLPSLSWAFDMCLLLCLPGVSSSTFEVFQPILSKVKLMTKIPDSRFLEVIILAT